MLMWAGCTASRENAGTVQPAPAATGTAEASTRDDAVQVTDVEDRWGIKILGASLSAGGYMVDFRFRVLDSAKVAPLLARDVRPHLVDQATGARFIVPTPPKVGQLRSGGSAREGKTHFIFFANPGRYVKSGNKVTVVIGDFEARDIVVQ